MSGVSMCSGVTGNDAQPVIPRMETYAGTSDGSGNWTVTFPTPFPSTPHINPVLFPTTDTETQCLLTSVSPSGFTCKVFVRNLLTVLGINLLSFAVSPVIGATIKAFVVST